MSNFETVHLSGHGDLQVVPAVNKSDCVDPRPLLPVEDQGGLRYRQTPDYGSERSPGATWGKMMALRLAVPAISTCDAVELVADWEAEEERAVTIHEDDNGHGIGCGHADKAASGNYGHLYGLSGRTTRELVNRTIDLARQGQADVTSSMLVGPHREAGVIVVKSDEATVIPTIGDHEFFRFDATRHDQRLRRLAACAARYGYEVTGDELCQAAAQQREATLSLLAPGAPIYEVDLTRGQRRATYVGDVPPPKK